MTQRVEKGRQPGLGKAERNANPSWAPYGLGVLAPGVARKLSHPWDPPLIALLASLGAVPAMSLGGLPLLCAMPAVLYPPPSPNPHKLQPQRH